MFSFLNVPIDISFCNIDLKDPVGALDDIYPTPILSCSLKVTLHCLTS